MTNTRRLESNELGPLCPSCGDLTVFFREEGSSPIALCIGHSPEGGAMWSVDDFGNFIKDDNTFSLEGIIAPLCEGCGEPKRPIYGDQLAVSANDALVGWNCGTDRCKHYDPDARHTWFKLGQISKPITIEHPPKLTDP